VRRGIAPAGAEKRDPPQGLSVRVEGVPGPWRVTAVRGKGEQRAWASVGWVRGAGEVFVVAEGAGTAGDVTRALGESER
jgi:hypothetical protein